jgi:hypothetical protein
MIEAISRQPSEMIELQNHRQQLSVDSDFASAFRGATKEAQASSDLQGTVPLPKAVEPVTSALSSGMGVQLVDTTPTVSTTTNPVAAQSTEAAPGAGLSYPAGWSGPPGLPGSSYNPIAAWGQVPGQQPPWISGSYPGATWTAVNEAGFLMPYDTVSPGSGEDTLSNANENVIDQDWAKYYDQADGTQAGNQIVWGANNPTDEVPAPWMASNNPDPQYTASNPSDPSQPTQPNFVAPAQLAT